MKKTNQSHSGNVTGSIGDMNYTMKDCPFHMPKENLKFFTMMQKASDNSVVSTYGNSYVSPKTFANNKPVSFT